MGKNRAKKKHTEIVPYFSTQNNCGGKKPKLKYREHLQQQNRELKKSWAKKKQGGGGNQKQ